MNAKKEDFASVAKNSNPRESMKKAVSFACAILLFLIFGYQSESVTEENKVSEPIVMVFGGDVTLGYFYPQIAPKEGKIFDWPFAKLKDIFSRADVVMVNCENAITNYDIKVPKTFNFKMNPELVAIFRLHKIQVTLANNHVFDYGRKGLEDTLKYLDESGIYHVGAGANLDKARKPIIRQIKGKKIAFLAYGNYSPAGKNTPGTAYSTPEHVIEDIREAKKDGCDYVVVNFHWGIERATEPTVSDRELAHLAINNGADLIIGHHPHVLQPVEVYKGKVIAYSLGNFVFGGNSRYPRDSMLLEAIFQENVLSYRKIPIRIDPQETRYQPYILKDNDVQELDYLAKK